MLYLGIDQHARQITISLRDENGDVVMARQVSTRPEKRRHHCSGVREDLQPGPGADNIVGQREYDPAGITVVGDYRRVTPALQRREFE